MSTALEGGCYHHAWPPRVGRAVPGGHAETQGGSRPGRHQRVVGSSGLRSGQEHRSLQVLGYSE